MRFIFQLHNLAAAAFVKQPHGHARDLKRQDQKYNANKKIAQLTKVVFRLHTENLDRRDYVIKVRKECRNEMEEIINKANSTLEEIKNQYDEKFSHIDEEYKKEATN